jgi:hypothetical protein
MEVLSLVEEWAENAKDAQGRKLRKDGLCALVGVVSLPREIEDDFPQFAEDTLVWLKQKYGDRLKSVVVHDDCTGSDYLDTVLQLRPPFAWHKPDGLRGVT